MAMRYPKRKPMKQWVKEKLDNKSYPGLKWMDKSRGKFEISWKHGSLQDWSWEDDVLVFREWAIYTGKYRPQNTSITQEDLELAKKWKTNFRCALNALPGVEFVRAESYSRGAEARKVYIMKKDKKSKNKRKQKPNFQLDPFLARSQQISETTGRDLVDLSPLSRGIEQEEIEKIEKELFQSTTMTKKDDCFSSIQLDIFDGDLFHHLSSG